MTPNIKPCWPIRSLNKIENLLVSIAHQQKQQKVTAVTSIVHSDNTVPHNSGRVTVHLCVNMSKVLLARLKLALFWTCLPLHISCIGDIEEGLFSHSTWSCTKLHTFCHEFSIIMAKITGFNFPLEPQICLLGDLTSIGVHLRNFQEISRTIIMHSKEKLSSDMRVRFSCTMVEGLHCC